MGGCLLLPKTRPEDMDIDTVRAELEGFEGWTRVGYSIYLGGDTYGEKLKRRLDELVELHRRVKIQEMDVDTARAELA